MSFFSKNVNYLISYHCTKSISYVLYMLNSANIVSLTAQNGLTKIILKYKFIHSSKIEQSLGPDANLILQNIRF